VTPWLEVRASYDNSIHQDDVGASSSRLPARNHPLRRRMRSFRS
jgi:hypothetical protein